MPFINLQEIEQREQFPGFRVRHVAAANMSIAYWDIAADSELPEHSHLNEQVLSVLEGEIEFTIAGETRVLGPGSVAVIPSNAVHSGRTLSRCKLVDVVHPVWESPKK